MGRKTGKSRKKYWKSKELAEKTNEITELSRLGALKKEIADKANNELFLVDTSKQWVSSEGVYSANSGKNKKSCLENRTEIDEWKYHNEKYKKKQKFTPEDLDKKSDLPRDYSFDKDIWRTANLSKKKKSVSKPNANEHLTLPSGGVSYNPSFTDHQQLLVDVLKREETEEAKLKEERDFWAQVPSVTHQEKEAAHLEGIENFYFKQKLCEEDKISNQKFSGKEDVENVIVSHAPLSNRKLKMTPKQRDQLKRKAKEKLNVQIALKKERLNRGRENDALHGKSINKKISKIEHLRNLKWKAKQARKNDPKRVRLIGRTPPEEIKTSFKLTEELPGSLRKLVPESDSLFTERIASLIKRNVIEPMPLTRSRMNARQRHIEKRRHKMNFKKVIKYREPFELPATS